MDGVAFNVNGIDRTDVLASAAAHAEFGLGLGDGQAAFKRNHMNGLDGAVLGAGSATGAVHLYHTDINVEDYATRLCMVFSSTVRGLMAPVGQTCPQMLQS